MPDTSNPIISDPTQSEPKSEIEFPRVQTRRTHNTWIWEIFRSPDGDPVDRAAGSFGTQREAKAAGEIALARGGAKRVPALG